MMNEYDRKRLASLLAWRAFARSAGIFTTVVFTLSTENPVESLGKGIIVWMFFYLIRQLDDRFVDRNIWSYCSSCVYVISLWLVKTPLLLIAGIVAVNAGAQLGATVLVFGGLLIYDLYFVFTHGS